jgi:hypothetical protein
MWLIRDYTTDNKSSYRKQSLMALRRTDFSKQNINILIYKQKNAQFESGCYFRYSNILFLSCMYNLDGPFTSLVIARDFTFWIFIIYCRCTLNLSVLLPQSIHFFVGSACTNPTITTVLE